MCPSGTKPDATAVSIVAISAASSLTPLVVIHPLNQSIPAHFIH